MYDGRLCVEETTVFFAYCCDVRTANGSSHYREIIEGRPFHPYANSGKSTAPHSLITRVCGMRWASELAIRRHNKLPGSNPSFRRSSITHTSRDQSPIIWGMCQSSLMYLE